MYFGRAGVNTTLPQYFPQISDARKASESWGDLYSKLPSTGKIPVRPNLY
jgi:hypothetical protein